MLRRRVRSSAWLVSALGIGLIVSGGGFLAVASASVAAPVSAQALSALSTVDVSEASRPDSVSATVTARASGERVEDESQRTEFTRVYANPDGTWTNETATGPESVQGSDGAWHDIDTTLVERDGALVPRAVSTDLVLSDGGDRVFASMSRDDQDLDWRWGASLPEPVVDGSTATYPDVVAGGDLVVTATPGGFTHSLVLRERPEEPVEVSIPIATDGGDLLEGEGGQLQVTEPDGTGVVVTAPAPVMWDSSDSAAGELGSESVLVDTTVGETASGTPELTLTPDIDFLNDPDTVYPVTVDPSFTHYSTGDSWVSNVTTASQQTSQELRVGTQNLGGTKSRSYLKFDNLLPRIPAGSNVITASLVLRNFESLSCNASAINVAQVSSDWTLSGLSWTNQPSVSAHYNKDYAPAKGFDASCQAGDATWDVWGIVNDWYTNGSVYPNRGLRLKAVDETVNKSYRRYRSADYTNVTANQPHIDVTYNRPPGTPTVGVYDTMVVGDVGYVATTTPTFLGIATDLDADQVSVRFEVHASTSGSSLISSCQTPAGAPNSALTCVSGSALPVNTTMFMRAKTFDGQTTLEDAGGWSPWLALKVNRAPVLQGSWTIDPCTASCSGPVPDTSSTTPTFRATASDSDTGTTLRYTFSVRDSTTQQVVVTGSADAAAGSAASWTVPTGALSGGGRSYQAQVKVWDFVSPEVAGAWSSFRDTAATQPSSPGGWSIAPCAAPCPDDSPLVSSSTPTMTARSTDADGDAVQYTFTVRDSVTGEVVSTGTTPTQPQGQTASWAVPDEMLVPGTQYQAQVSVADGSTAAVSGPWHAFLVTDQDDDPDPTVVVPEVPIESASEPVFEPGGDSDVSDELGTTGGAVSVSAPASLVAGSWATGSLSAR
jgi:hypothetical protein